MNAEPATWKFHRFGLFVTGKGEREWLAGLFRGLQRIGQCTFVVCGKVEQLKPITSQTRRQTMVGKGRSIPEKDVEEVGIRIRNALGGTKPCDFVLLIDDLDYDGDPGSPGAQEFAVAKWRRYRAAIEQVARKPEACAVFFLANMLEAYYWADTAAVNAVMGSELSDHVGDVEHIRHPKNRLKNEAPGFDERAHGKEIVSRLDLAKVLGDAGTCAHLRTLFAWCFKTMGLTPGENFRLHDGIRSVVTGRQ